VRLSWFADRFGDDDVVMVIVLTVFVNL